MRIVITLLLIGFNISLQAQSEEEPFTYKEKMPQYDSGTEEMYKFIYKNMHATKFCQQEGDNVQVTVQFAIDTTGYVVNPKIISKSKGRCDDEALRIVNLMNEDGPHWSPGEHNGRKVSVTLTLPIMFNPK